MIHNSSYNQTKSRSQPRENGRGRRSHDVLAVLGTEEPLGTAGAVGVVVVVREGSLTALLRFGLNNI